MLSKRLPLTLTVLAVMMLLSISTDARFLQKKPTSSSQAASSSSKASTSSSQTPSTPPPVYTPPPKLNNGGPPGKINGTFKQNYNCGQCIA